MIVGLLGSAVAGSVIAVVLAFGVLVGASSGLDYATAVRVAGTVASGRGLALGLVVSAYAVGSAVLAPVASTASTSSPLRRRPRIWVRRHVHAARARFGRSPSDLSLGRLDLLAGARSPQQRATMRR
ncbi:hypothetical protein GCM10023199_50390 [Actinomycetospora chibensis]|jgi:hypothetical protein